MGAEAKEATPLALGMSAQDGGAPTELCGRSRLCRWAVFAHQATAHHSAAKAPGRWWPASAASRREGPKTECS